MKTAGDQTRYRGLDRTGLAGHLLATAYNLVRWSSCSLRRKKLWRRRTDRLRALRRGETALATLLFGPQRRSVHFSTSNAGTIPSFQACKSPFCGSARFFDSLLGMHGRQRETRDVRQGSLATTAPCKQPGRAGQRPKQRRS